MSDETQTQADDTAAENQAQLSELDILKNRARNMGITFSNNIKVDALRKKIEAKQNDEQDTTDEEGNEQEAPATDPEPNPLEAAGSANEGSTTDNEDENDKPLTPAQQRAKIRRDATKLVRIRLTCMDPKKKDLPGELIVVANRFIGTVKKFIPFGSEFYENGYHVPYCIFRELQSRKFLQISTKKGKQGQILTKTAYVREFGIEILEPLTEEELRKLAAQQAASNSLADDD